MVTTLLTIGRHQFDYPVIAAPMAGVSDLPFRRLCLEHGASYAVAEMISANPDTRQTQKSQWRSVIDSNQAHIVQIVGHDPQQLAQAARLNQEAGADIIDINMGCPAKKVCKKAAGSALLANEALVQDILVAVKSAVDIPVTLKIRTGTSPHERNATTIARIAQEAGIAALTIHGRTKACAFKGAVEYDTIAEVVSRVEIPVIANGDITHPDQALKVLNYTGAAGIMVGRGAQGQPWLLGQIKHKWRTGEGLNAPSRETKLHIAYQHVAAIHEFYGDFMGLRFARKHAGWYFESMNLDRSVRSSFNQIQHPQEQLDFIQQLTATLRQDAA